jgi:ABC-type nickel/cobalt efflux system permease component RcnA
MTARFWIRLAEISFVLVLATAILVAWREDRRDRAQLAVALEQAKQALSAADARQHDRDAQLSQTLATLAAQKNRTQTPSQILADLPNQIPLPVPMTLEPVAQPASSRTNASSGGTKSGPQGSPPIEAPKPQATQAVIPSQDLKPLYDFALDCKSCQAKLTTSQGDLADEKAKTIALSKERDAAVKAAKGGSILQRVVRAAKWFALGAAAGALAAKTAR